VIGSELNLFALPFPLEHGLKTGLHDLDRIVGEAQ
jgi:hypothetical protein